MWNLTSRSFNDKIYLSYIFNLYLKLIFKTARFNTSTASYREIFLRGKNGLAKVFKNLAKYESENNFVDSSK